MNIWTIILCVFAMLAWVRTFIYMISVVVSREDYRDPTVADLEYELNEIRRRKMEREKKRSMK